MAPSAYIEAREAVGDETTRFTVDGQPYMPFLVVDPSNSDSVKHAVALLLNLTTDVTLSVTTVSGGITNALFRVSGIPELGSVLVRVFGAEGMIDRDVENATYASLYKAGVAPAYYGRFANGRLEQWLDGGYHALKVDELSDAEISNAIAIQMAKLHTSFAVPEHLQQHHDPTKPSLWTQLHAWMKQALESSFQSSNDTERAKKLNLEKVAKEIDWLEKELIPKDAKTAFCHNDLLAANVMWNASSHKIQLIDFEYGGINFSAFDIANHFNEFAGGTEDGIPNYDWFPTVERQEEFVKMYLETATGRKPTQQETEELLRQVQAFCLANHLYWGLWGVNQAAMEGCNDFDYLLYGKNRIAQYYKCKTEHNGAEKPN